MRLWLAWCLVYLCAVTLVLGIATPYPGDESRFIETSRLFGRGVTVDLLRHYPEMSGPLPFLLYAGWGNLFQYSLPVMRLAALLIALVTLILLYVFLHGVLADRRAALLSGIALCFNPYMAGLSLFVYTDMPALLFTLAALIASLNGRSLPMAAALAAAALSRQYMVFLSLGLGLYFLVCRRWAPAAACALSILPLALLAWLWGGLAPDSWMRAEYLTAPPRFEWSSLSGYLAQMPFYLLPFVIVARRALTPAPKTLAIAALAACAYWFFPVRAPEASRKIGLVTAGLLDRALFAAGPLRDVLYWLGLTAGLLILRAFFTARTPPFPLLAALILGSFLFVMPWSYLYWEKYLLPVLPVVAARLALMARESSKI